jgi:hypothetical protein
LFIVAALAIVDLIAVADAEALLGVITPDRSLNEPRKCLWKALVELRCVDLPSDGLSVS